MTGGLCSAQYYNTFQCYIRDMLDCALLTVAPFGTAKPKFSSNGLLQHRCSRNYFLTSCIQELFTPSAPHLVLLHAKLDLKFSPSFPPGRSASWPPSGAVQSGRAAGCKRWAGPCKWPSLAATQEACCWHRWASTSRLDCTPCCASPGTCRGGSPAFRVG